KECYRITGGKLEADAAEQPFSALHLRIHRSKSRKTRRGVQVKHQISESRCFCQAHNHSNFVSAAHECQFFCIDQVRNTINNCQGAYYILFRDKACDRCSCKLPYAKSKRNEQDCKWMCNTCE